MKTTEIRFIVKKNKAKHIGQKGFYFEYYVYDTKLKRNFGGSTPISKEAYLLAKSLNKNIK